MSFLMLMYFAKLSRAFDLIFNISLSQGIFILKALMFKI